MINATTRKPGTAAILSFALPGLGQIYNGRYKYGSAIFIVLLIMSCLLPAAITMVPAALRLPLFWLVLTCTLLIYLYAVSHAFVDARRGEQVTLGPLNHGYAYTGLWLLATVLWLGLVTIEQHNVIHSFRIPSLSMAPTINAGDYLMATMRPGQIYPVKRGDIVIFIAPDNRNLYYIKRAVGIPGDRVSSDGHTLFINGVADGAFKGKAFDEILPHGKLFLIGDDRAHTLSSRDFGNIPIRDVVGKPILKWHSVNGDTGPM